VARGTAKNWHSGYSRSLDGAISLRGDGDLCNEARRYGNSEALTADPNQQRLQNRNGIAFILATRMMEWPRRRFFVCALVCLVSLSKAVVQGLTAQGSGVTKPHVARRCGSVRSLFSRTQCSGAEVHKSSVGKMSQSETGITVGGGDSDREGKVNTSLMHKGG